MLDELKSSLVTTVSHELRTPLTSIYGFVKLIRKDFSAHIAEVCRERPELSKRCARVEENLGIIEIEGRRLGRMINDFLDLSKIESGRMAWNDALVLPGTLMARAAQLVQPVFEAKGVVELLVDIPEDLPPLLLDEDRMVQVLVNLLDNACKHTSQGEVRMTAALTDAGVRFTVADTGRGIPTEDLPRIFEKFYQSRMGPGQSGLPKGTGLGLTICRQIVEHYRGRIWADSEPGVGSTFHVLLPLPSKPEA